MVAFWILAVVSVGAAVAVVSLRDIFRAALCLILCFFAVAGLYITLNADFLAAVQVLIYVGAVAVLIIFAIMFTRQYQRGSPGSRMRVAAFFVAGCLMLIMVISFVGTTTWPELTTVSNDVQISAGEATTAGIARVLFEGDFLLPFEIAGALLLATIIGALVMARTRE